MNRTEAHEKALENERTRRHRAEWLHVYRTAILAKHRPSAAARIADHALEAAPGKDL